MQSFIKQYAHLCHVLKAKVIDLELKYNSFTLTFPTVHISHSLMDMVYNWYDDRYQSEVLFYNTATHTYDRKVKVTDLKLLCLVLPTSF